MSERRPSSPLSSPPSRSPQPPPLSSSPRAGARLRAAWHRLAGIFRRRHYDDRLEQELAFHADMLARDHAAAGVDAAAARRLARLRLAPGGSLDALRESYRARRGVPALENLARDLRFALRTLRKSPGFTAVALLSLALGIGTNSAIFSLVDALLLRSLPVPHADRLAVLTKQGVDAAPETLFSYPSFVLLQQSSAVATGLIAVSNTFSPVVHPLSAAAPDAASQHVSSAALPGAAAAGGVAGAAAAGASETLDAQLVSGNLFAVLGVRAAIGRTFTAAEDVVTGNAAAASPVAVMSYAYWQRHFGGSPSVVGQLLQVNGAPIVVLGVLPRGFRGVLADEAPDLFLPLAARGAVKYRGSMNIDGPTDPKQPVWTQPNEHWLQLLLERRRGVSLDHAAAVLRVLYQRELQTELAGRTQPEDRRELLAHRLLVSPGARGLAELRDSLSRPLLLLLALAGLVLMLACTNVATLLLARADARRKEMAVRLGIGAGRGRVVRQLVTESLLLAGLGAALGLAFAAWSSRLLLRMVSSDGDPIALDVDFDWRKVAFSVAAALVTGLIFGLAPALHATRVELGAALKQGERTLRGGGGGSGSGGRRGVWAGHRLPLGRLLVAAQIALSLVLLVGAGLFVRSLQNLLRVDPGYAPAGLVTAKITPWLLGYDDARLLGAYDQLVEHLQAIPGVRSASLSRFRPLTGSRATSNISLPGYDPRPNENMDVDTNSVTPGYFATVGLTLVAGRALAASDRAAAPLVAVVNQAMVRRFLPRGVSPIGRRFGFGGARHAREIEIVGVVRDVKLHRLAETPVPIVYQTVPQALLAAPEAIQLRDIELRLDPAAGESALAGAAGQLRRVVAETVPGLPVLSTTAMTDQVARSLAGERAVARLAGFFGLLALLLAAIGLYGVMSYGAARRTGEMGLRLALGAQRSVVLWLLVREAAQLLAVGVTCGLAAVWWLARLVESQLFGLAPHDPATLAVAAATLGAVALAAAWVPARRAAATPPLAALRQE